MKHKSSLVPYLITFHNYNKTQNIDGIFYIHIVMKVYIYLECKVDVEFNWPGLKIIANGCRMVLQ